MIDLKSRNWGKLHPHQDWADNTQRWFIIITTTSFIHSFIHLLLRNLVEWSVGQKYLYLLGQLHQEAGVRVNHLCKHIIALVWWMQTLALQ